MRYLAEETVFAVEWDIGPIDAELPEIGIELSTLIYDPAPFS
jgi:hypothetical protein